jgi:CheY-like chemotaxis protein
MSQKILIVDDDKFLLDMYALKFSESGYEVSHANNAAEALAKVDEGFKPDVFLVDVIMPEMDGFTLVEELKKRGLTADSAVIVLSNLGQEEDVKKGLQVGADGYIIKASATPSEVIAKVAEIAGHKKKK